MMRCLICLAASSIIRLHIVTFAYSETTTGQLLNVQ